ncbi:MAG TPA: hypothetical protein VJ642_10565 [Chromobacteriaceae bacterium]|nr:hypothetical protein [Chromobacteriaceae bacterium]
MSQAWLSYDKAPPVWLPAIFFVAAMLWLLTLGMVLLPDSIETANRYQPQVLALTHVLGLGVLGNIMAGAILQMLAVASAVPTPHPRRLLFSLFLPWQAGTGLLVSGFLHDFSTVAMLTAAILLSVAVIRLVWHGWYGLARSPARDATSQGIALALVALFVTALLGLSMVLTLTGQLSLPIMPLLHSHVLWAAVGWLFLLLLAVSQTVIPMFLVTPPYPAQTARLAMAVVVLLVTCTLALFFWPRGLPLPATLLLMAVVMYAALSWRLLRQSRRQADPVWWQWRVGMICLLLGGLSALLCTGLAEWPGLPLLAGLWWLGGVGLSATLAMLGKIAPFLSWLHLKQQNPPRGLLPSTHGFLAESAQLRLCHLHLLWLLAGTLWCWQPGRFHILFALVTLIQAGYALYLASKITQRYQAVKCAIPR